MGATKISKVREYALRIIRQDNNMNRLENPRRCGNMLQIYCSFQKTYIFEDSWEFVPVVILKGRAAV